MQRKSLLNTMAIASLMVVAAQMPCSYAQGSNITVDINQVDEKGVGTSVGQITISESTYGLIFTPALHDLPPGLHGFHLHENASCLPKEKDGKMIAAGSAGAHFDPAASKHHGSPWGDGHLGDLPAVFVDSDGKANQPVLAPRLKMSDVQNHALMLHAGADNHSDQPAPLGGGGPRIACGSINP